ncbi:MAG: hypothetical protein RLZZ436_251 [Planctomycetota bacterium]|jgi:hypothetical protein
MFFWIRELAGWGLVGGSLFILRLALGLAMNTVEPRIVEAAVVLSAALGMMRAGILLIRMSTAARLARTDRDNATNS